jgi:hypothetical protein
MQQILQNRFAPRWIMLMYVTSVIEAIGLAVYFSAPLTDPEMASMQPLYADTQISQEAPSTAAAQPDCPRCMQFARSSQHASIKRDYADHNAGRMTEAR